MNNSKSNFISQQVLTILMSKKRQNGGSEDNCESRASNRSFWVFSQPADWSRKNQFFFSHMFIYNDSNITDSRGDEWAAPIYFSRFDKIVPLKVEVQRTAARCGHVYSFIQVSASPARRTTRMRKKIGEVSIWQKEANWFRMESQGQRRSSVLRYFCVLWINWDVRMNLSAVWD